VALLFWSGVGLWMFVHVWSADVVVEARGLGVGVLVAGLSSGVVVLSGVQVFKCVLALRRHPLCMEAFGEDDEKKGM